MKNIKLVLSTLLLVGLMMSCNSEPDDLGLQLFENGASSGSEREYDLVVYNIDNQNIVRSDASVLNRTVLGAFNEAQFGLQKSSYVTQIRMSSYDPKFGINPVVDSVTLEITPEYFTTQDAITKVERDIVYKGEAAKETVTSYKTVKYGKDVPALTIQVDEINEDLGSTKDEILSNKATTVKHTLGVKLVNGNAIGVEIGRKSDNANLLSKKAAIRIPLSAAHFQNKVVSKEGSTELKDETAFVNYFKGLKISIQQNDGYFINFNPNEVTLTMHYTNGDVGSRISNVYAFNLGASNVHFNQVTANRSTTLSNVLSAANPINGDDLLYTQGMGGSSIGVKMEGETFETLKTLFRNQNTAIISAKIRLYTDTNTWNNSYTKPTGFLVNKVDETKAISDVLAMITNAKYKLVTIYSATENPTYYDINITKTVKEVVEQGVAPKNLELVLGEYIFNSGIISHGSKAYTPYRAVFVGSNQANANRAKLLVTSVTK